MIYRAIDIFMVVALFGVLGLAAFTVFEHNNSRQNRVHPVEVRASKLPERGTLEWKMDFEGLSFEEATEALEAPGPG